MSNQQQNAGPLLATDALGRALPTAAETGLPRKNRTVGLFYFLWNGEHMGQDHRPFDVSKILSANPKAGYDTDGSYWGKVGQMHHWGEPMFGYYYAMDEWVMRKHIEMITRAEIDFLVFDTTNNVIYEPQAKQMLRLLSEYRREGWNTPKVLFYTNTRSGETAQNLYEAIYKPNYMPDTWYCFDGKPLIIAVAEECSPEVRAFFTIKMSQWPNEPTKKGGWPWMDFTRPQRVFENAAGEEEVINVSVAQHPQLRFGDSAMYGEAGNRGRSYHNGAEDPSENAYLHGYNFAQQWERAIEADPPFVFVTGWNEWLMGRWQGPEDRPLMFVDCADIEYSRDIEPMKGGYFDNYYMQLISYVRKYKGTAPIPVQPPLPQPVRDPSFALFRDTPVVYRDFPRGAAKRSSPGYGDAQYTDESGRNEIIECRVVHDSKNLYFYAKTSNPIQACDYHSTWMNLYLNISRNGKTADAPHWHGYQYLVNQYPFSNTLTSLSVCRETVRTIEPDTFSITAAIPYACHDKELMVVIPKALVGLAAEDHFQIQFKWADSKSEITRMEEFYTKGDAAPIGRLNYVFEG